MNLVKAEWKTCQIIFQDLKGRFVIVVFIGESLDGVTLKEFG